MNLIFAVMNDGARCFLGALPPAIDVPEWAASRKKAFKILDIAEIEYMSANDFNLDKVEHDWEKEEANGRKSIKKQPGKDF